MDLGASTRWTITQFNNTGSLILAGEFVVLDPDAVATVPQADAQIVDPYGSPTAGNFIGLQLMVAAGALDELFGGVALEDIPDGQPGIFCILGNCLAKVAETGSDATGTAYGGGATAGQLSEVTPATGVPCRAIQIGTSGTTTTGDLRLVFVHGLWGLVGDTALDTANPIGGV